MTNTEVIERRLRARHRAEKRFRAYGRLALGVAGLMLLYLLWSIIVPSLGGFTRTEMRLLNIPTSTDFSGSKLMKEALLKEFPEVTERRDRFMLFTLVSGSAVHKIEHQKEVRKKAGDSSFNLWVPVSDPADMYAKGKFTINTPESDRRLKDPQILWLDKLKKEGNLRTAFNWDFFLEGDSRKPEQAGFLGSIVGSLLTLAVCVAAAFPLGVLSAVYLEEFAPRNRIRDITEVNINNLAAVPSIVFGLLGLALFLNLFGMPRSAPLVGGMTLALMTLPVIIISTRAALRAVPDSIRQAALGLGASPLQVVLHHTLPLSLPGIMTGTILGMARAIGETAPLLMIGMVAFIVDIPGSFTDPATVMPVQVFLWASSPEAGFVQKTAAGIVTLIVILLLMNALAIYIRKRYERRW